MGRRCWKGNRVQHLTPWGRKQADDWTTPLGASCTPVGKMTLESEAWEETGDGSLLPLLLQRYLRWRAVPLLCPQGREAGLGSLPSPLAQAARANSGPAQGQLGTCPPTPASDDGCGQLITVSATIHPTVATISTALTSHSESLTTGWRHS